MGIVTAKPRGGESLAGVSRSSLIELRTDPLLILQPDGIVRSMGLPAGKREDVGVAGFYSGVLLGQTGPGRVVTPCTWSGWDGFVQYVRSAIASYSLLMLARLNTATACKQLKPSVTNTKG
jgi:hypothetical protein